MSAKKKVAAVVTAYYPRSHADVIVSKFHAGFPTADGLQAPGPRLELVLHGRIGPCRAREPAARGWQGHVGDGEQVQGDEDGAPPGLPAVARRGRW